VGVEDVGVLGPEALLGAPLEGAPSAARKTCSRAPPWTRSTRPTAAPSATGTPRHTRSRFP
jgi:hypothetical protein